MMDGLESLECGKTENALKPISGALVVDPVMEGVTWEIFMLTVITVWMNPAPQIAEGHAVLLLGETGEVGHHVRVPVEAQAGAQDEVVSYLESVPEPHQRASHAVYHYVRAG